jgi:hypothetical protein
VCTLRYIVLLCCGSPSCRCFFLSSFIFCFCLGKEEKSNARCLHGSIPFHISCHVPVKIKTALQHWVSLARISLSPCACGLRNLDKDFILTLCMLFEGSNHHWIHCRCSTIEPAAMFVTDITTVQILHGGCYNGYPTKIVEEWLWTQVILWKRWKQGVSLLVKYTRERRRN